MPRGHGKPCPQCQMVVYCDDCMARYNNKESLVECASCGCEGCKACMPLSEDGSCAECAADEHKAETGQDIDPDDLKEEFISLN